MEPFTEPFGKPFREPFTEPSTRACAIACPRVPFYGYLPFYLYIPRAPRSVTLLARPPVTYRARERRAVR